jgi:signal transduction histidine kinase
MAQKKLIFLILLICTKVFGQVPFVISPQITSQLINQNVWIYEGKTHQPKIEDLIKAPQNQFNKNNASQDVSFGYNRPEAWCKVNLKNTSTFEDFRLHIEQSRLDSLELFVIQDGKIHEFPTLGRHVPINERIIIDRNYVFPLKIPKDSILTIYVYSTRKFGSHGCIFTIKEARAYQRYVILSSSQFGFIFGCSIVTGLIGLVIFLFIHEKTYLAYSLYCFGSLLVGVSDSGYMNGYIHILSFQNVFNLATIISFYILISFHIFFTVELLNIKAYKARWFYILGKYSIISFSGLSLILFLPIPEKLTWWIVFLSYYAVFFMDAYIIGAIFIGIQKRSTSVYFYMFGFFLTLFVYTLVMLANLGVIDNVNSNMEILYFTPLIEIIVMVIGLSIRFKDTLKERFVAQKSLNESQKQIINLQEDERTRIASDLHDDVGNSLAALKAKSNVDNLPEYTDRIQEIINDLRDITHNIMPANFKESTLDKMIAKRINRFKNNKKINFEFISAGEYRKIEKEKELSIYRIIDELITNLLKHSDAKNANIQLIYQENQIVLTIEDDGKPFAIENQKTDAQRIGIRSLLARLNYLNAKFHTTNDKNGNILIIDILYQNNESQNKNHHH